jgi:type IV pilus assembly protein PilB
MFEPANRPVMPNSNPKNILSPKDAFKKALSGIDAAEHGVMDEHTQKGEGSSGAPNVVSFVNNAIENAINLKVSDIHFEIFKEGARLRYRCDGIMKEIPEYVNFLFDNYAAITTRIKIMSQLDISERRLPQDGRISFPIKNDVIDIRVSVLPTACGERVVMRIMDKTSLSMPIDRLGFQEQQLRQLEKAIHSPQGMILVTGPTGSGKSTTLYAVLNTLNGDDVNILTAEDPVEFNVAGIGQVHVKENIGLTFAAALRSFLRQDPEIIMVGEIRDKDTAEISVKAALTGHLVLSTLHTNDATSTITRLINMGIPSYLLTSSLCLVVAQRLARVICPNCKIDDPEGVPEKLRGLGFSQEQSLTVKTKKGKGCDKCMGIGCKGRRGIHEVLTITKNLKVEILKGTSDIELCEIAVAKDGFITMQERGRQLIAEGVISIAEYERNLVVDD